MSLIKVGQTKSESSVIEASTADKQPTYVNGIPEKTVTDLTNSNLEDKTVVDLLLTIVTQKPEANAVVYGSHALTFKELDVLSNQLAHYLRQRGVKEETMVPICMERSLEMIIGILGILKAGGAYVPIDPLYPPSRINLILEDIDATLMLTQQRLTSRLVGISSTIEVLVWETIGSITDVRSQPVNIPKPHHLAYVIFTSGSTGKPKGVLVEHAQLLNATQARTSYYKELSNVLLVPSFSFDASVGAIFGSLTSGSCLYLCSQDDLQDTRKLQGILPKINTLLCVPSYYGFLLEEGLVEASKLSKVILGGEPLTEQLTSKHFSLDRNIELYNEYGPTEATIWATVDKVAPGSHPVPIGLPIAGAEATFLTRMEIYL